MNKTAPKISLSEIDDHLMSDKDGSFRAALIDRLNRYSDSLRVNMERGNLTPDEFDAAKKMKDALIQASAMIRDR